MTIAVNRGVGVILLGGLIVALATSSARAMEPPTSGPDYFETIARTVVNDLAAGRFDKVVERFDPIMAKALPKEKLAETWRGLQATVGEFKEVCFVQFPAVNIAGYRAAFVACQFAKARLAVKVVFSPDGKISGLFFVPVPPGGPVSQPDWSPPPYAKPEAFGEAPITIRTGRWELPGTLTMPKSDGPFPAVVLLAGSGPHDADETIGPNKPLKDLAWGLASRSVAVIRYVKRTSKYGAACCDDPKALTVNDEYVADARAAVALATTRSGIDPKRVYLLGHSEGGYIAPRIASGCPQVAGIILLAGNSRTIPQLVAEQVRYLVGLNGPITPQVQSQIDAVDKSLADIDRPDLKGDSQTNLLGASVPGSYWLDLRGYHPVDVAARLKIPILILQGEKDYQVRMVDFQGWKDGLAGHANATFRRYPSLNHLFMVSPTAGNALATPAEYEKPGHVAADVIEDLATWIASPSKALR